MNKPKDKTASLEPIFYGTAGVGTKGQIVIPKDARAKLKLEPGDKVVVFGNQEGVLAIVKADRLSDLLQEFGQGFKK